MASLKDYLTLHTRKNEIIEQQTKEIVENIPPEPIIVAPTISDLEQFDVELVAKDFPFDESQKRFIQGLITHKYACGTGSAGTGKTTCTKAVVDGLRKQLISNYVDLSAYWKSTKKPKPGAETDESQKPLLEIDDDEETFSNSNLGRVPSICIVGYTGKSTQMIRKNFPERWHTNIMTIHRMLGFAPEWYEDISVDGATETKMRFVPTYTKENKLPWDIIIIDEAGMLGVDLWHQILDATKPSTRIFMIGDINQLQPVHGKSAFGFAMAKWPTYELTTIHRQAGANNSIVDAAWNVIHGRLPVSDGPNSLSIETDKDLFEMLDFTIKNKDWKFLLVKIPQTAARAAPRIRKAMLAMAKYTDYYSPDADTIITAINGKDGQFAEAIGQIPMNREFVMAYNPTDDRYMIDANRETKLFAVGDKVMATVNDHEIGITNGMVGMIEKIIENAGYSGDKTRFGKLSVVNSLQSHADDFEDHLNLDGEEITGAALEQLIASIDVSEAPTKEKVSRDRGPASHSVDVRFGNQLVTFASMAEVNSLQHAYVTTCHKMQGSEASFVATICHHEMSRLMTREWLYTAITRSQNKHILFYTTMGLKNCLSKQLIKGRDLKTKIMSFANLSDNSRGLKIARMPENDSANLEDNTN